MSRLTRRAEADGVKAVWFGNREVFLEGETGYAEADKLAHYEDLEEAGRLIELPCAIGDDIYKVPSKVNYALNILSGLKENNRVYHQRVTNIVTEKDGWYMTGDMDLEYGMGRVFLDVSFGETWFLTKAEAEAKLEELKGGE